MIDSIYRFFCSPFFNDFSTHVGGGLQGCVFVCVCVWGLGQMGVSADVPAHLISTCGHVGMFLGLDVCVCGWIVHMLVVNLIPLLH